MAKPFCVNVINIFFMKFWKPRKVPVKSLLLPVHFQKKHQLISNPILTPEPWSMK